jgi:hypothetical protein
MMRSWNRWKNVKQKNGNTLSFSLLVLYVAIIPCAFFEILQFRLRLRAQLTETGTMLQQAQAQNLSGEVQASRTIQKLKADVEHKELEVMRIGSDIDWSNERIQKLEQALEKATLELKARSDLVEKWEIKTVEQSKKIEDLEK